MSSQKINRIRLIGWFVGIRVQVREDWCIKFRGSKRWWRRRLFLFDGVYHSKKKIRTTCYNVGLDSEKIKIHKKKRKQSSTVHLSFCLSRRRRGRQLNRWQLKCSSPRFRPRPPRDRSSLSMPRLQRQSVKRLQMGQSHLVIGKRSETNQY